MMGATPTIPAAIKRQLTAHGSYVFDPSGVRIAAPSRPGARGTSGSYRITWTPPGGTRRFASRRDLAAAYDCARALHAELAAEPEDR